MKTSCTGIILSGGENKRFGGYNKAFFKIGPLRIVDYIYNALNEIFDTIIIVTNDPIAYTGFDCYIVTDHYTIRSSLNGIHAGLFASKSQYSFFVACDTPFINKNLARFVIKEIETNKDIIVPKTSLGFEPLFAVYSKNCIKPIENQIEQGNLQIKRLFNKVRIKELNEEELKKKDPTLRSFINVNSHNDLVKIGNNFEKIMDFL